MNEQAVGKLVEVLREVPPKERDEMVVKAKNQLEEEEKESKPKKEDLEKLFDTQIQTLKDRGCPAAIIDMLREQRDDVLQKASEITIAKKHIAFLPVIPRAFLSIYTQMQMVRNGDKTGYTYLKPYEITDVVETPQDSYYIFDVEDGEAMLGKSPQNAEKAIKQQNWRGLTEVEVIALGIHTDVLSRHYVDAVGSRYESDGVPNLWLSVGRPELDWDYLGGADGEWGAASCRSN
jgi:hypothetical protein